MVETTEEIKQNLISIFQTMHNHRKEPGHTPTFDFFDIRRVIEEYTTWDEHPYARLRP